MITTIREKALGFDFDPRWRALKWDGHELYVHGIQKLKGELTEVGDSTGSKVIPHGSKAVDILAVDEEALYFIEIKDFRGFAPENAFRQEKELPLEVGLKVRDSLAGLLGAYTSRRQAQLLEPFVAALRNNMPVKVIAWLAEDSPSGAAKRKRRNEVDGVRAMNLARSLGWLTRHVWVDDPLDPCVQLAGVRVYPVRS